MHARAVLLAIAAVAAFAAAIATLVGSAHGATTLMRVDGAPWGGTWQRWADQSRIPTPTGQVTLRTEPCPVLFNGRAAIACILPNLRVIYVRLDQRPWRKRALLHELGHLIEHELATDNDRAAWAAATGRPWTIATELFADAYADCALDPNESWRTVPGSCPWIRSIAARSVP